MSLYSGEVTSIQRDYETTLHDTCLIGSTGSSLNSFGEPSTIITNGSPIPCAIEMNGGMKKIKGELLQTDADATLRLPYNTTITPENIVTITSLYGVSCTHVYKVFSAPKIGIAGITVELKRVVT